MDFKPMHPDVWARTNARRWNHYIQLRLAYEDGREHIRRRRGDGAKEQKGMADFLKKHGVGS
jgi:hypothetical protein